MFIGYKCQHNITLPWKFKLGLHMFLKFNVSFYLIKTSNILILSELLKLLFLKYYLGFVKYLPVVGQLLTTFTCQSFKNTIHFPRKKYPLADCIVFPLWHRSFDVQMELLASTFTSNWLNMQTNEEINHNSNCEKF